MRRSGSSGPLRVHLIPSDPLSAERIKARIRERPGWRVSAGLQCRIPHEVDLVMVPADRCAECLDPAEDADDAPAYLAYGDAGYLASCVLRGCSDFLKDPWDAEELEFRLGRFARPPEFAVAGTRIRLETTRLVSEHGATAITPAEHAILQTLARRPGRIVTRAALFYAVWGAEGGSSRLVDVYISRLRRRLGEVLPIGAESDVLRSIRGRGYTLEA